MSTKMKILVVLISCVCIVVSSCAHKNNKEEMTRFSDQFGKDTFTYTGNYVWSFDLMGGEQISTHGLYADSITYTMQGKVYSTAYTMKKISYEKLKNKWIGEDASGIVYVLFFKAQTDSTITIYKHKCKNNGLEEALSLTVPAADATENHGWNVYSINADKTKDVLPVSGRFVHAGKELFISDSLLVCDNKNVVKMSYHSGERRWVGKYKDQYVQVFFKTVEDTDAIQLSLIWYDDLEKMYSTKYKSITNWENYARN